MVRFPLSIHQLAYLYFRKSSEPLISLNIKIEKIYISLIEADELKNFKESHTKFSLYKKKLTR